MRSQSAGNLRVGIFTFNRDVHRVYPASGEAGSDWATALANVGTPPVYPDVLDTGIQPSVGLLSNVFNNDSYFASSMTTLATSHLTAAGDGTSLASPRKVLFLVTDGFEDDDARRAMPSSVCQQFKNMGYTVFVIYTPYYPVTHPAYLDSWISIVEGTGTDSITYNLKACASVPSDFISAADGPSLNAAVLTFLKQALTTPARLTK
jgi:hypothetical protein